MPEQTNVVDLRKLLEARLSGTQPPTGFGDALPGGVPPEYGLKFQQFYPASPAPAAVLVPLVERDEGLTVLLTQRSAQLRNHAGQISFPGGRIDPTDDGAMAAALRETEEEIGLSRDYIRIQGYLEPHIVLTGFCITPVVGFVRPGFSLELNSSEVDSVFEMPLLHLLDEANHSSRQRDIGGERVPVYDIPFGNHRIWGATAGILMALYRLLKG